MLKRVISILLTVSILLVLVPAGLVSADGAADAETVEISNQYIKVLVNKKNGGYVISTLEGDILKKSDDNVQLTHRGDGFDTSFTSFRIDSDDYVFGSKYGLFGSDTSDVVTEASPGGEYVTSTWSVGDFTVEQKISLVNNAASEQLGTAMIGYTVKNNGSGAKTVRSRVLIDTQLGDKDYGYYEVPKQNLGQGYEYFEFERTWDSSADSAVRMPSDYFVRDNPYTSSIVGFGVNSVFTEQKPYKMTFAHWANIAATIFDYTPDTSLNFTNNLNSKKTADSAAALYYNLGSIAPGQEKTFSTYYGVTANLKNKDNRVIINTTAPSKLEFRDDSRTAYEGSEGTDNVVRINVSVTNPQYAGKEYKHLAAVVYALSFETQRQTDGGSWVKYNNADPIYTDIIDFRAGENRVTYFDFKFEPQNRAQLGSFVIKVFDMDETVNELGAYAEEYCLGTTENHIILPGRDASLPAITLAGMSPDIIYNDDIRYITVTGQGMSFFKSDLLNRIELRGDNGKCYEIPIENLIFDQADDPASISLMLEEYMEPGRYSLHFLWKNGTGEPALDGVPEDFTSDGMFVQISSDKKYYNSLYGIVTVQRKEKDKYTVVPYKNEAALEKAKLDDGQLLLAFRGDIQQDRVNKSFYRLYGKDKDININRILNYHGDTLTIEEKADGTAEVLMNGKITTVGANTTVRNGTAAFRLKGGTEYLVPEYDEDGEVTDNGALAAGQDFIELKWDNAFDTLTTIGGFLIDMKYGVLGKIRDNDDKLSDIISFGGSLDLGFMTPGGAAAMRQNTAAGAKWTTKGSGEEKYDDDDYYSFGLTFDEDAGEFRSQTNEKDIAPTNNDEDRVEAGATIHDVLFGGKRPGYIGINMDAHVTLPQIVKFLPNKIEGELSVNTINGYRVGVDADVETGSISMAFSLVVKSSDSGAPIPDKLYFSIGGFEPGINIDNLGVLWVTGGGGGFDKLYETVYGKDGVPPLTLLLHVEFDVTKILTGNADLELSLRSLKLSFSDLSLKMLKDAKFIDGGEVAVGWYPNFNLNLSAGVNFAGIMHGSFTITAAAGGSVADFVQFVLNVSIGLPKYIPIVGGMELASAELGGGSQKVWGAVEVLSLIKVGFTYYWGGSIEFSHGNPGGGQTFAAISANDDEGVKRTKALYNEMLEPVRVGTDPATGETQFALIGGNLSYSAGSVAVSDFEERARNIRQPGIRLMSNENAKTEIFTNSERTSHIITFGDANDYILSISRADGSEISEADIKSGMKLSRGGSEYGLRYYTKPEHTADDSAKKEALQKANVNISGNAAYIAIPKSDTAESMLLEFSDGNAYDVSAVRVNPISVLSSCTAQVSGNTLTAAWDGKNMSDTAEIIITATDSDERNSIILNETKIPAGAKSASAVLPEKMASGDYKIRLTLSDEGTCYDSYDAGTVTVTNDKAPNRAAESVAIENCGDDKLKITVVSDEKDFDGYIVEMYEDGKLAETGLYFDRDEEIIVGGRYEMPLMDKDGKPTGESRTVGYTPGKRYSAKVRLCNIEDPDPETRGDEVYHCSAFRNSAEETLRQSTPPAVAVRYNKDNSSVKISSDVPVSGELYINSASADGEWYKFTDKARELSQEIRLADGIYTLEFYAEDEHGDHAIVKEIVSIDTTPPVVLLAAPQSGGCFSGDSITVTGSADADASYTFKINGNIVLPKESNIFADGMLKCTLPLGAAQELAKAELEITAKDSSGNETVKQLILTNQKLSEISAVSISSPDGTIENGRLTLGEGESANLRVTGITKGGERFDVTELPGVSLEITGGTSAELDGTKVTAGFAGQSLVRAGFGIGGDEYLYDGLVIAVADRALIYSALEEAIADAKKIESAGYTLESWNALQDAIKGAEQILSAEGVTQDDIDSAATAVANAVAALTFESSSRSHSGSGGGTAYYTISFNTNGGSNVESQKLQAGQRLAKPDDPTRDGYSFDGWYTDKELRTAYDFDGSVTKSFTLYAKWTQKSIPDEADRENTFADVGKDDWFSPYVEYAARNGLMSGVTDTLFDPDGLLTRAMLVTVLWRADGRPQTDSIIMFEDVDANSYYTEALRWASSEGIVRGYTAVQFAPDDYITREQLAAIIHRYADYKGYDTSAGENTNILSYTDAESISEYAIPALQYAVGAGLIKGKTDTTVNPLDGATRAETAAILQRFIEANK